MTFEPVVELNSNVLCQRLISGKGLGQIRPKPRSRACRLAALVAVSAAICARVRRTRLCGARGLLSAGTLKRGKRAICLASTGTLRLPYRAPVPLLLSWPQ